MCDVSVRTYNKELPMGGEGAECKKLQHLKEEGLGFSKQVKVRSLSEN